MPFDGAIAPRVIVASCALLAEKPAATREQIAEYLDQNLCRCGSHFRILEAVEEAAGALKGASR
jgi:aerobic-type carbon monoxide dehydrogenase small subunit (CoxS/CutS family)